MPSKDSPFIPIYTSSLFINLVSLEKLLSGKLMSPHNNFPLHTSIKSFTYIIVTPLILNYSFISLIILSILDSLSSISLKEICFFSTTISSVTSSLSSLDINSLTI